MKRLTLTILTLVSSATAHADYSLYDGEYGELAIRGQLQTVTMFQGNNWLGEPNINKNSPYKDLDDVWAEITIEPAILGAVNLPGGSQFFGGLSYLFAVTYGHDSSGFTLFDPHKGADPSKGLIEEGYVGWRSGTFLKDWLGENAISISVGHQDYKLGTGFLLYDGANDGAQRAGWWMGARTAFNDTIIARINVGDFKLEGFHLENRPREPRNFQTYHGMNIEYQYEDIATLGFTYLTVGQARDIEGADVFDARVNFKPLYKWLPNLTLEAEYVHQQKSGSAFQSEGGYGQISYLFEDLPWKPKLTYRYAGLQDDYAPLAYGFSDWGTWYQGEINGEHILDHTNTLTHMARLSLSPRDDLSLHLFYFHIDFDNPSAASDFLYGSTPVTNSNYGDEINLIADWVVNDYVSISGAIEAYIPGEGGKQMFNGGNKTWFQGMIYTSFGF